LLTYFFLPGVELIDSVLEESFGHSPFVVPATHDREATILSQHGPTGSQQRSGEWLLPAEALPAQPQRQPHVALLGPS
jgi:hypothetical protein